MAGREGAKLLLRLIAEKSTTKDTLIEVPATLVVRSSTQLEVVK